METVPSVAITISPPDLTPPSSVSVATFKATLSSVIVNPSPVSTSKFTVVAEPLRVKFPPPPKPSPATNVIVSLLGAGGRVIAISLSAAAVT
jgi:hypothetical protein